MKQNTVFKKWRQLLCKAKKASKDKGIRYVIRYGIRLLYVWLLTIFEYNYHNVLKSLKTFTFHGSIYHYFSHSYNKTWKNERAVEVPIIWKTVNESKGKKILEVGNVLSHYFSTQHDILDKYEKAEGVINQDVVDYRPSKKYDLIISISTLEHVGFDEENKDLPKILHAIKNLKNCLASGGKMVVTLPLGYNPELDELLKKGKLNFTERYFLKRISADNNWIETTWDDVKNCKYNEPFPCANGIVVGIIEI